MSIKKHLGNLTPTTDQKAALEKLENFLHNESNVFILTGYAGTGKTTLISTLIAHLKEKGKEFSVMAPTGRAAKILREKTGIGYTIHKSIYNFNNLVTINKDSEDEAEHSFHYIFPINRIESIHQNILIIDESSMIGNNETKNELFTFGTNRLLNDLLTYSSLNNTKNKIVFIGDPAQLPPVGDNASLALDKDYFLNLGLTVETAELKEIKRQSDNLILRNATKIRDSINDSNRSKLAFDYDDASFIKTGTSDVVERFTTIFPKPEIGDGIVIAYSNQQCFQYNRAIRSALFPDQHDIVPGDLLLLNSNNYHTYGVELFNGDILKVIDVDHNVLQQSAPVWISEKGSKVRKEITLVFRRITFRILNHPEDISCLVIDSHLNSVNRDLSFDEMRALYINFVIRFNEVQRNRKEQGLTPYKVGSDEFKQELKNDPYFNALRVKYGYAITCHKSQGGEWKQVFVDYFGRVSLRTDPLRWCYTATTRAIETLFAINAPKFSTFSKLKFSVIGKIGTLPLDAYDLTYVPCSPYHSTNAHRAKSLKYWEVQEKLEGLDFQILGIESKEYLERYKIKFQEYEFNIEASHKGSGHFIDTFKVKNYNHLSSVITQIESIFNSKSNVLFKLNYYPQTTFIEELFSIIQSECLELDIIITNIVEHKNYINFYFITDSICSYIQFYFNDKGAFSTAMPKTFECDDDLKLKMLISKLTSNVI